MDLTVLNLAVPKLSVTLRPSSSQLLWLIDIYGFLVAGSLITMGTLGDRIGRRRLLLFGAAAFAGGSVLAAFSRTAEMLIATRALLGLAGATLAPSTLSLIRNLFLDPRQRRVAVAWWITSYSVGAAIGPLIGGVLLEHFWWGSVFLIAVPVMLLLLAVGPVLLPEFRDSNAGRPDVISAAMSVIAVLLVIYGLKKSAQDGLGWAPALSIVAGAVVGYAFIRRQKALEDPLIDIELFIRPAFSGSLATYMLVTFVAFGSYVFIAQYLQLVLGLSPLRAGLWTLPLTTGFIVGSQLTPVLARQFRPAFLIAGGLVLGAAGFVVMTQVDNAPSLVVIVTAWIAFAIGSAPAFTLTTDLVIGAAPPEKAGAAAAISETSSELGGALGIAILGSIGTAVYRRSMAAGIPAGLSADEVNAARGTLGGALGVAEGLPSPSATALRDAARLAFTRAMEAGVITCATVTLITALIALALLRRVRPGHEPTPEHAVEM
jgi:DHA2 family multidrug resistance protein-like MFS transporter